MSEENNAVLLLYPTTKFFIALLITVSSVIIPGYIYAYSCFFICAFIAWRGQRLKEFMNITKKTIFVLVVLIFLMQLFFYPGSTTLWEAGFLRITTEGINYGLNMSSRVLAIGCAFIMFFRITDIKEFVLAIEKNGFSPTATYVILATLQMVPEMRKQSNVIMDAQRARGVETEGNIFVRIRAFIPVLGPLILSSIASTEERAITLESRAFTAPVKKTRIHEIHYSKYDKPVRIFMAAALILIIVGRIALWIL